MAMGSPQKPYATSWREFKPSLKGMIGDSFNHCFNWGQIDASIIHRVLTQKRHRGFPIFNIPSIRRFYGDC